MGLALLGVAVVVTSVSVFGALRFDEPPPPTDDEFAADVTDDEGSTTTATTIPPRLDDLLPDLTDRLTLVAERDGQLLTLLWDPSFREPQVVALDIEETPAARFTEARFDRGGRLVAVERCGELRCDLFVGTPTDLGRSPDLRGTLEYRWHATEVGRIAWVTPAGEGYEIRTGEVNPLSGAIEDQSVAFAVAQPVRIIQWDGLGFVLRDMGKGSVARTVAADPTGEPLWERAGSATSATDRIVAVQVMTEPADSATPRTEWSLVDRLTGEDLSATGTIEPTAVFVGTSESADLVAQLTARDTGPYSLRVSGGSLSAQRIVTIQQRYAPVGFTDGGTYFVLTNGDGNIVFVRWNQGSSHEVVAPDGYRIIGLDLG